MKQNTNCAPVDDGGEPPDDETMEARIARLESDLTAIKIDVAVIKATCATKSDLAELKASYKADLAEFKASNEVDLAKLEASSKADLAKLEASSKSDLAELKGSLESQIAKAKVSIILWVVTTFFLTQLLPHLYNFVLTHL